eukprot:g220.t1
MSREGTNPSSPGWNDSPPCSRETKLGEGAVNSQFLLLEEEDDDDDNGGDLDPSQASPYNSQTCPSQTQPDVSQTCRMADLPMSQCSDGDAREEVLYWGSLVPQCPNPLRTARFDAEHAQDNIVVGRSKAHCSLVVDKPWVARKHLEIRRLHHRPGHLPAVEVRHLGTQNASYLNGRKLLPGGTHELRAGDMLSLVLNPDDHTKAVQDKLFAVFEWQTFRLPPDGGADTESQGFGAPSPPRL